MAGQLNGSETPATHLVVFRQPILSLAKVCCVRDESPCDRKGAGARLGRLAGRRLDAKHASPTPGGGDAQKIYPETTKGKTPRNKGETPSREKTVEVHGMQPIGRGKAGKVARKARRAFLLFRHSGAAPRPAAKQARPGIGRARFSRPRRSGQGKEPRRNSTSRKHGAAWPAVRPAAPC